MKRSRLLNSELSYEIAKIGHTAHITLCDAGLPIPNGVKRIDLAVEAGLPSFISVLKPILSEMQVEEIVLAEEIKEKNPVMLEEILKSFEEVGMNPNIIWVKHEEFKKTIQELQEYLQDYEGPTEQFSELVQKNVIDWLFGHIKTYDRSVAEFIFMRENPDRY